MDVLQFPHVVAQMWKAVSQLSHRRPLSSISVLACGSVIPRASVSFPPPTHFAQILSREPAITRVCATQSQAAASYSFFRSYIALFAPQKANYRPKIEAVFESNLYQLRPLRWPDPGFQTCSASAHFGMFTVLLKSLF
jgi:hypothetical protein